MKETLENISISKGNLKLVQNSQKIKPPDLKALSC